MKHLARWQFNLLMVILLGSGALNPAWGHPMPSSAVELHLRRTTLEAELTLPVSELALGWQKPLPRDAVLTVREYGAGLKAYVRQHVRPTTLSGRPWTVSVGELTPVVEQNPDVKVALTMMPPPGAPVDQLIFNYDVIFHRLITHTAVVSMVTDWHSGQLDGAPVLLGTLRDTDRSLVIDRSHGSWWRGFLAVFQLGERHIQEGTDHLLFLLALLLPAPLVVSGKKWGGYAGGRVALWRILKVVSAFTLGHSLTLLLGALGWVHLPGTFVESAIALSIFVSAIHALTPIFRGKEVFIAAGFGLLHGMAFASTLTSFGFDTVTLVSSVFAFNLGIEVMQFLVILATLPWLVALARTPLYPPLRSGGAALTGIAALSWFAERAFGWSNPISPLVEALANHGVWLLAGLVVLTGLAILTTKLGKERALALQ